MYNRTKKKEQTSDDEQHLRKICEISTNKNQTKSLYDRGEKRKKIQKQNEVMIYEGQIITSCTTLHI